MKVSDIKFLRINLFIASFFVLVFGICQSAYAVVYPGFFIVKKNSEKHIHSEKAKFELSAETTSETGAAVLRDFVIIKNNSEIFVYDRAEKCKDSISSSIFNSLFFEKNYKHNISIFQKEEIKFLNEEEVYTKKEDGKIQYHKDENVNLGRFKGQIAFILGGNEKKKDASQIWFNRENFLPLKVMQKGIEIVFEDYKKYGEYYFPSLINVIENEKIILKVKVKALTYPNKIDSASLANDLNQTCMSAEKMDAFAKFLKVFK